MKNKIIFKHFWRLFEDAALLCYPINYVRQKLSALSADESKDITLGTSKCNVSDRKHNAKFIAKLFMQTHHL